MIGRVNGALLAALTATDVDRIADALLDLSVSSGQPVNREGLRRDLTGFLAAGVG